MTIFKNLESRNITKTIHNCLGNLMTLSFLSSPDFPRLKQEVLDLNFQTFLKLHNVSQQDRDDWAGIEQDKAMSSHPISFPSQTFL